MNAGTASVTVYQPCNLPWGGTIAHGESYAPAYSSPTVAYGSSCASVSTTLSCSNGSLSSGSYPYTSCSVSAPSQPGYPTMWADASSVGYGAGTTIRWSSPPGPAGWSVCYLYRNSANIQTVTGSSGAVGTGALTAATNYFVDCYDNYYSGPYRSNVYTVYINAPSVSISASPTTVNYGGTSALTWSSSNATSCTLSGPSGVVASGTSGNYTTPGLTAASNTYTVSCSGPGGSTNSSAVISVNAPVISMTACNAAGTCSSPWVNPGKSAFLTYTSQSVGSCTVSASPGGTIFSNTSGTSATTPTITTTTTYTFSCTGSPTPTPVSRTVTVVPACAIAGDDPVTGWAWSETSGWLSLDCVSAYAAIPWPSGHDTQNWGLALDSATGLVTGYAWSETLGWVKFGGLSSFPSGLNTTSANARIVGTGSSAAFTGWARACSGTSGGTCSTMTSGSGWDGWISLAGSTTDSGTYQTNFVSNPSYLPQISGAWAGTQSGGPGWLAFKLNPLNEPGCTISANTFQAGETTTLSYSSHHSTSASINQGIGVVSPNTSGTRTTPAIYLPTLYTMSVSGPGGSAGCNVLATPANTEAYGCLSVNSPTCAPPRHQVRLNSGSTASLFWDVENATECELTSNNPESPSFTGLGDTGTRTTAALTRATQYVLTCEGTTVDRVTITLNPRFIEQ